MRDLPNSITAGVFRSANAELGWRRDEIEQALLAIRDNEQAVLGGEVWLIVGPNQWHGLIPDRSGGVPGVWTWNTLPRSSTESWRAYCERTVNESLDAVRQMKVEEETLAELADQLRFNATYIDETEVV